MILGVATLVFVAVGLCTVVVVVCVKSLDVDGDMRGWWKWWE